MVVVWVVFVFWKGMQVEAWGTVPGAGLVVWLRCSSEGGLVRASVRTGIIVAWSFGCL